MKVSFVTFLAAICLLHVTMASIQHHQLPYVSLPLKDESASDGMSSTDESLHFHMVGDFGLYSDPATEAQNYYVSDVMSKAAQEDPIDFIVSVGDNFYTPNGLESTDDPRIDTMMNVTYNKPGLADKPWYLVLGNHDCYGTPEIEVSLDGQRKNWNFPSTYYDKTFEIDSQGNQALFMFLNGCLLSCKDPSTDEKHVCGGFSFVPSPEEIDTHIKWVKDTLKAHSSNESIIWKTVVVHWPMFSIADGHGDSASMKKNLLKQFFDAGIDVVLSGHDHVFQYINMSRDAYYTHGYSDQSEATNNCIETNIGLNANSTMTFTQGDALHQIVSGNGGDDIYRLCFDRITDHEDVVFAASDFGFVDVRMDANKYEIRNQFARDDGKWKGRVIINRE